MNTFTPYGHQVSLQLMEVSLLRFSGAADTHVRPHMAAELPVPQAIDERAKDARQHDGEQVAAKEQRAHKAWLPVHQQPVDQW